MANALTSATISFAWSGPSWFQTDNLGHDYPCSSRRSQSIFRPLSTASSHHRGGAEDRERGKFCTRAVYRHGREGKFDDIGIYDQLYEEEEEEEEEETAETSRGHFRREAEEDETGHAGPAGGSGRNGEQEGSWADVAWNGWSMAWEREAQEAERDRTKSTGREGYGQVWGNDGSLALVLRSLRSVIGRAVAASVAAGQDLLVPPVPPGMVAVAVKGGLLIGCLWILKALLEVVLRMGQALLLGVMVVLGVRAIATWHRQSGHVNRDSARHFRPLRRRRSPVDTEFDGYYEPRPSQF